MCFPHTFNWTLCPVISSVNICNMSLACFTQTVSQCIKTKSELYHDRPEWFSKIWAVFTVHLAIHPTINNRWITKHSAASFPSLSQNVEANIQNWDPILLGREACITTPSKQGSPTGRAPFCQEQGRVSLPRSHWSIPVLLFSDWLEARPGPGIDSGLDSSEGQSV